MPRKWSSGEEPIATVPIIEARAIEGAALWRTRNDRNGRGRTTRWCIRFIAFRSFLARHLRRCDCSAGHDARTLGVRHGPRALYGLSLAGLRNFRYHVQDHHWHLSHRNRDDLIFDRRIFG